MMTSQSSKSSVESIGGMVASDFFRFPSRRSVVHSTGGMIGSSQPLANDVGYKILQKGGNAADAAIAVAAALNVTEPCSTGIGGDMFCLYYDAKSKTVRSFNGSGRAPKALTLKKIRELGITGLKIPLDNINAVTVPGAAAGWVDVHHALGSGNVSLEEILTPAIDLAEKGFPVSEIVAYQWRIAEDLIKRQSDNANEILRNGSAPKAGQLMKNPTLAQTFRTLAKEGKDGFYKGRIAEAIVNLITSKNGVMTLEDLANHTTTEVEPATIEYGGLDIWECPPNGQGLVALLTLGILRVLEEEGKIRRFSDMQHNSAEHLHAVIEALRLAFADGQHYITDPDVEHIPLKELLSKEYLSKRAQLFDPTVQSANIEHGSPVNSSDTVYFSTADKDGNACSFIISNYAGFGTAAVPKGCGFTLQNRGSNFNLEEGHPNCIQPNKRPYHTIIPSMVTKNGELWASFGVMGGFMQPQGHVQVLLNLQAFGLSPQSALDAPRICIGDPDGHDGLVFFEDGIDQQVIEQLRAMGHKIEILKGSKRALFGRGQIIRKHVDDDGTRIFSGGSDPRADGAVIPCLY
jgi:gamma-glutamyltranspeptidase/glutathione hydrolase